MTLITNYIGKDYIILAGDKRNTSANDTETVEISRDNVVKIFPGDKYCIGIQGTVKTKKSNYISRLTQFIEKNHDLLPPQLTDMLINEFADVFEDTGVEELNLTISGANNNELFSYFIDTKNQSILNCRDVDEMGIRFNSSNSFDGITYRQAIIFLSQYMGENKLSDWSNIKDLNIFNQEDIVSGLKHVYERFGENNSKYRYIGPTMDYYIIYKNGVIETNIDSSV